MTYSSPTQRGGARGQITPIAWIYIVFGFGTALACVTGAEIGPAQLSAVDAVLPALLIVASAGAILRRPWGRWLCYAFSVLLLPAAPTGTIIGGLMIYHLTIHRDQFRRSAPTLRNGR
jgi:predicted branched-subunit amino acid permease